MRVSRPLNKIKFNVLGIFQFLYLYETRDCVLYYLLGFDFASILKHKGWLLLINAFCSKLLWITKNNVGGANSDAKESKLTSCYIGNSYVSSPFLSHILVCL